MDLLKIRRNALSGATRRPAIDAFLEADARTGPAPQSTVQQQPGSLVENARQRALMALGASPKPSMGIPQARLVTPTTGTSGLRSMLPQRGTPGSAALGAFGSTMSQLGGYQDKPMTFGQILGASLGEARKAYGTAEERQRQIAAEKAAAERQAQLDELSRRNIESQIAKRDQGKVLEGKAIPWKQQTVKNPETGETGKADVAFLPLNSPLIAALGGDPTTGRVVRKGSFIVDKPVSKENIRTVTGVGVVDFSNKDEPKILMESEDPRRFSNLGPYRQNGKSIGEGTLDRHTGKRFIEKADGSRVPIPDDAIPVTEGMAAIGIPNFGQFKKIREELNSDEVSMRNYANYLKNIENSNQGVSRIADDFTSFTKTFLSTKAKQFKLSEEELAKRIAEGQLQGLLGAARIETVGGGVMTEQDALRVIMNLGGNVDALQNKEVVKAQITRLFSEKYIKYGKNITDYNNAVQNLYSDKGYSRKSPVEIDARLFDSEIMSELGVTNLPGEGQDVPAPSDESALNAALGMY